MCWYLLVYDVVVVGLECVVVGVEGGLHTVASNDDARVV